MRLPAICLLLLAIFHLPAQPAGKRLALIIGNSAYEHGGALKNPVNDARAMAAALQSVGFEVIRYENQTLAGMKKAINEFGLKLRDYEVGLFYYAGHGIQHKGLNYMIPVEADLQAAEQIEFDCVAADRVLAYMETASSKVNIIILDACRNNPFERSWSRNTAGSGLALMNAPKGTFIAYATAPGRVASDGESANGLYTSILLKYLNDPALTIEQVFKKVRTEVTEKSAGQQIPWETTSLTGGDFYFAPKTSPVTTTNPVTPATDADRALQFYSAGMNRYNEQKFQEAITEFSRSIQLNPLDFQAFLWRGHSKYSLGYAEGKINEPLLEEAILDYTRVIELDPANSDAYFYRANSKKLLKKLNEAIPDFTLAARYDPKKSDIYYYRGLTYYQLKKYLAGAEDFSRCIAQNPDNLQSYYWRGACLFENENYPEAIADFTHYLKAYPNNRDALLFLADAYFFNKQYEQAQTEYENYLKSWPEANVLIYLAHCQRLLNQTDQALATYQQVAEMDPGLAAAYYWRSYLFLYEKNDKASARKEIQKALAINPDNESFLKLQSEIK